MSASWGYYATYEAPSASWIWQHDIDADVYYPVWIGPEGELTVGVITTGDGSSGFLSWGSTVPLMITTADLASENGFTIYVSHLFIILAATPCISYTEYRCTRSCRPT